MDSKTTANELNSKDQEGSPKLPNKLNRKVSWRKDTVDNELMGKKKYDCSNLYKTHSSNNIEKDDQDVKYCLNCKAYEKIDSNLTN